MSDRQRFVNLDQMLASALANIKDPVWGAAVANMISTAYSAGYLDCVAKRKPQNRLFMSFKGDPRAEITPEQITDLVRRIGASVPPMK